MKHRKNSGLWDYLEELGILEHGTDQEIKAAKRAYRKRYLLQYKRNQRTRQKEFAICLSIHKGEYHRIKQAALRHHRTVPSFLKAAVFAYLDRKYLVPNPEQLYRLEQILADYLNEIQRLVSTKEKYSWERDRKLEMIENRLDRLEKEIEEIFTNPPSQSYDHQNQNL